MRRRSAAARLESALAGLRQLGGLGLPDSQSVPQALSALHDMLGTDTNHFTWADGLCRASNYYGEGAGDDAAISTFFANTDALSAPGSSNFSDFLSHWDSIVWSARDPGYLRSPLYNQVMRPLGGEDILCVVVRDAAGRPRGSITMMRDRSQTPFSPEDEALMRRVAPALSLLFQEGDALPTAHDGEAVREQGMAVLDDEGRLLHCDAVARRLLRLAGHPCLSRRHFSVADDGIAHGVREVCARAARLATGRAARPPVLELSLPWGRLLLRGHLLGAAVAGQPTLIGLTISHHLPARLVTWRQVQALDLSIRQRQVCLPFALGHSLSDIAAQLGLSRHTVIDHINCVYDRLGIAPDRETLRSHLARMPLDACGA